MNYPHSPSLPPIWTPFYLHFWRLILSLLTYRSFTHLNGSFHCLICLSSNLNIFVFFSGGQAWQQAPLSSEPSSQSISHCPFWSGLFDDTVLILPYNASDIINLLIHEASFRKKNIVWSVVGVLTGMSKCLFTFPWNSYNHYNLCPHRNLLNQSSEGALHGS